MPYALCPMPYALCPVVPHLSEKGYIKVSVLSRGSSQALHGARCLSSFAVLSSALARDCEGTGVRMTELCLKKYHRFN